MTTNEQEMIYIPELPDSLGTELFELYNQKKMKYNKYVKINKIIKKHFKEIECKHESNPYHIHKIIVDMDTLCNLDKLTTLKIKEFILSLKYFLNMGIMI